MEVSEENQGSTLQKPTSVRNSDAVSAWLMFPGKHPGQHKRKTKPEL